LRKGGSEAHTKVIRKITQYENRILEATERRRGGETDFITEAGQMRKGGDGHSLSKMDKRPKTKNGELGIVRGNRCLPKCEESAWKKSGSLNGGRSRSGGG